MLAACTSAPPASVSVLPAVKEYSCEFTSGFLRQLAEVPAGSPLDVFTTDSVKLRAAVRAARGDPVPPNCPAQE